MLSDVAELVRRIVVEGKAMMMANALIIMTKRMAAKRVAGVGSKEVYGVIK